VGILLHQYQTQIRVERAKMQLAQGVSIQQVAVEVGFVDQSHLTRHFKRFVGITPGKYRLRDRKNRD
jgi:AraC-like DNA-binding protein